MTFRSRALLWAGIIITAALIMNVMGAESGASFGVIAGLSGAAWASVQTDAGCGRSCLQ